MILEKQKEAIVLESGQAQDSIGMSLDLDSAQILMQMLSKNLYSDPIGSTIRECASNALDSHRRAGVEEPIVVSFERNDQNNFEFSVEDFGIGLDADDVKNIISKYGKSTKRDSATELGMMGLGFKAPLAYSSSFYFVCRKDGIERKYMMYEGEDVNTIDLLYELPTEERNGVKIIVPVSYKDAYSFQTKIKEQLAYFENVYFNSYDINNDFFIFRSKTFQFSELAQDDYLHICLDNVYYPIDFNKLGISPIRIPIGIRFSLSDGIFPIPNREALKYTEETKDKILEKIKVIANHFVQKYNDSISEELCDLKSAFDFYSTDDRYVSVSEKGFNIFPLLKFSTVKIEEPKMKGVQHLNLKNLYQRRHEFFDEYQIKYSLQNTTFRDNNKRSWKLSVDINKIHRGKCYLYEGVIGGVMKDYLRSIHTSSEEVSFIKRVYHRTLFGDKAKSNGYYHLLNLHLVPKSKWRSVIKEYQDLQDAQFSHLERVEDIVIPKSFLDSRKKKKGISSSKIVVDGKVKLKLEGEVIGKIATDLQVYAHEKHCKFVPIKWKVADIPKMKCLIIYADHEDSSKLDRIYQITKKQQIKLVTFSKREIANLSKMEIHNLISYDEFMEGKSKPFKRVATAYLIHCLRQKFTSVFEESKVLESVSLSLATKVQTLSMYRNKYYQQFSFFDKQTHESFLHVAETNKLFDMEIYDVYLEVKTILESFYFIEPLLKRVFIGNKQDTIKCMIDLCKYHKMKVNLENYTLRLTEETVTEEQIQELIN